MIYAMYGDPGPERRESAQEIMDLIVERRWLPEQVQLWRADSHVDITLEDLQVELGHRRLGIDEVTADIESLMSRMVVAFGVHGLEARQMINRREVSTSGIPGGGPSVGRLYGNPCCRMILRIWADPELGGVLGNCLPADMRAMLDEADPGGWHIIHSEASGLLKVPGMRPYREVTVFLSKPRGAFDAPLDSEEAES